MKACNFAQSLLIGGGQLGNIGTTEPLNSNNR